MFVYLVVAASVHWYLSSPTVGQWLFKFSMFKTHGFIGGATLIVSRKFCPTERAMSSCEAVNLREVPDEN